MGRRRRAARAALRWSVALAVGFSWAAEATWTFQTYAGQNRGGAGAVDAAGPAARFFEPQGLAYGPDGSLYVADGKNQTIRKVSPGGAVTTLAGSPGQIGSADGQGAAARFNFPMGVAVAADGTVYVADSSNYTIRKITPSGLVSTLAGSARQDGTADGWGADARFWIPFGVAVGPDGTVYVADTGNKTLREVSPAGRVTTLAGSPREPGSADGTGGAARFSYPSALAVAADGTLLVGDAAALRKVTPAGAVTTLAGVADQPGSADGTGPAARFRSLFGLAVGPDGSVFVSDRDNRTVRRVTPGAVVSTLAGKVQEPGDADGTGTAARFSSPCGVAVGPDGRVFVADAGNHALRAVTQAGAVTTWAGSPAERGSADGQGAAARFYRPSGVAVAGDGTVYVADSYNFTIRRIALGGAVTTLAGSPGIGGLVDGMGAGARFNVLTRIAVGPDGNLYVGDTSTVRKVTPAGAVTTIAGSQSQGYADGVGAAAKFWFVNGIAVGPDGTIYVADTYSFVVRKVTPAGVVTTLAGQAGASGSADGPGAQARFGALRGIATGPDGSLYVADTTNRTVRQVTTEGVVTTLAGAAGQDGSVDGTGPAARFSSPDGIAVGADGTLYVVDSGSSTIRRVTTGGVVTTIAGTPGVRGNQDGAGGAAQLHVWPASTFETGGIAAAPSGHLCLADTDNHAIKVGTPSEGDGCVTLGDAACIADPAAATSFLVQLSYHSAQGGGLSGRAGAISLESVGVNAGGLFWFFSPDNPELLVKVLDGCAVNGSRWVFSSAGTNLGMKLDVTDTRTAERRTWESPDLTPAAPIVDVNAFPCSAPARGPGADARSRPPQGPAGGGSGSPAAGAGHDGSGAAAIAAGPCVPSAASLCLGGAAAGDGRFRVELTWSTAQGGGQTGTASALSLASLGVARGGLFWFFAPSNPEVLVKVLNGCGVNGRYWVFTSAGTNVGLRMTVTDTTTGSSKAYVSPDQTNAAPVQDVDAFTCS